MKSSQTDRQLDQILSRLTKSDRPVPDFEKWQQEHPAALQALKSQAKPTGWSLTVNAGRTIIIRRLSKLAVAAAIIMGATLILVHRGPDEQADVPQTLDVAKSPTDMLTAFSLSIAYRKGGMQAVDSQCEKAFEMLGQQSTTPSVRELLAELLVRNRKGQNHENR